MTSARSPMSIRIARGAQRAIAGAALAGAVVAVSAAGASASAIYWTNNPIAGSIGRADLDGTGAVPNLIGGAAYPAGIALDARHVYWANTNSGTIGRAKLDGTGIEPGFITGGTYTRGVAVDGGHVYWANATPGTIGRAALDGTEVNQSFITGASTPQGVAVGGGRIYWTNSATNTVGRAKLDGTGIEQGFITGASGPAGIAVDDTHVYWTNAVADTIGRANLNGTGADQSFVATYGGTESGGDGPYGVAVDGEHVYWTNWSLQNTIGRASLDGTGANQSFISGASFPFGVAVHAARASSAGADFGDRAVGLPSAAVPVIVTNTGTDALEIAGAAIGPGGSQPADFAVAADGCAGRTLAPGELCQIAVRFTPSALTAETGALVLTHGGPGSPQSLPLSGAGVSAPVGPAGPTGLTGLLGPVGPRGTVGMPAALVAVAYRAAVARTKVTVRYALSRAAAVTLTVRTPRGSTVTAARARGRAGLNRISWNRRIRGRRAAPGTYRLAVTATAGRTSSRSTIHARLR